MDIANFYFSPEVTNRWWFLFSHTHKKKCTFTRLFPFLSGRTSNSSWWFLLSEDVFLFPNYFRPFQQEVLCFFPLLMLPPESLLLRHPAALRGSLYGSRLWLLPSGSLPTRWVSVIFLQHGQCVHSLHPVHSSSTSLSQLAFLVKLH